jgi:hypothetical protein
MLRQCKKITWPCRHVEEVELLILYLALGVILGSVLGVAAQERDAQRISQAKGEGNVVFYTTMSLPEATMLAGAFEKRYAPMKVDLFRAGSGAITNRVQMEYGTRSYLVDVIQGVANR